jgi:hypothetical protein
MNPASHSTPTQLLHPLKPLHTHVNGVMEPVLKKKVLNEALDQIFGKPNVKIAEKTVTYPLAK